MYLLPTMFISCACCTSVWYVCDSHSLVLQTGVFSSPTSDLSNHRTRRQFVKLLDQRCRFTFTLYR